MRRRRTYRALLCAALTTTGLPAQELLDGPLMGMGVACLVDTATFDETGAPVSHQEIWIKKPGLAGLMPAGVAGTIDFDFGALFHDRASGLTPGIEIDGFSLGLDRIVVDTSTGNARMQLQPDLWNAVLFSVERLTPGTGSRGIIGSEQLRAEGAAADVFVYLLSNAPLNLPSEYASGCTTMREPCRTRKELDSADLGLNVNDPMTTIPEGNVVGIDAHLPAYFLGDEIRAMLPAQPRLYFTVTASTAAMVPVSWLGTTGVPSGATIFVTEWTGSAWSEPTVAADPSQLGLTAADEVDALSVDYDYEGLGTDTQFVFATPSHANMLRHAAITGADFGSPSALEDADGTNPVSESGSDRVRASAVCLEDPAFVVPQSGCGSTFGVWPYVWGSPNKVDGTRFFFSTTRAPHLLWGGLHRDCEGSVPGIRSLMNGWTALGRADGSALHVWMVGDPNRPGAFLFATRVSQLASNPKPGGPVSDFVALPSFLRSPLATRCDMLWSVWVAASTDPMTGMPVFAQSVPLRIRF